MRPHAIRDSKNWKVFVFAAFFACVDKLYYEHTCSGIKSLSTDLFPVFGYSPLTE